MNESSSRLDRLEALAEKILEDLQETRAIANSNARAVQAMMEQQATDRLRHDERMRNHEEAMTAMQQILAKAVETQNGLERMLVSLDEDRPTILRRLMKIEDKVDRLLERGGGE